MNNLLAILDLDHCIFQSEAFWLNVTELLERHYGVTGITAAKFRTERLDRRPGGPGRVAGGEGYDFFAHLSQHGVDSAAAEHQIIQSLRGNRWLYPGSVKLISYLRDHGYTIVIETTGADRFQQLKVACAANLPSDIPVRAFPDNKGDLLRREWESAGGIVHHGTSYAHVLVIDNSATTFAALGQHPGLTAVQIVGREKSPEPSPLPWVHKVTTLSEIPPLIPITKPKS
ncbi:MAG TPA: hypothetical protein VGH44_05145 [Candidatus Saccharimonadia bacterium]|jgi:hypothetical protein